ncbi:MAG: RNA polymerase sigma factor [Planctomycetota bacterium]
MDNNALAELASKARSGCQESMGLLCERFQDEISRYVYRLTLNRDLTEDIRQETLLQMCKSLKDLRNVNNIRAWLLKTAWSKTMKHYRSGKKHKYMSIHENNLVGAIENGRFEGLQTLVSKEIAETLVQSISNLKIKERSVLILRCYENLSYAEIASIMNCSETAARIQFFRAKNNLKRKLQKKGIATQAMFLGLLGLFGQVTSTTEAAVTVSASTLKTGVIGTGIGYLTSKFSTYLLTFTTGVGILVGGAIYYNTSQGNDFTFTPKDTDVKSFHFTKHAWKKDTLIPTANLRMGRSLSKGAYEQWFFFPEGTDGPLFKMIQRWDPKIENKLCGWLLNEKGQHYYHSGQKTIYLMNNPLAKKNTARFPSDGLEFCEFLDSVEGEEEGVEYVRDPKTGLLTEIVDRRFVNAKDFVSGVERNTFDETEFGNFRYRWPEDAAFIDERDAIHQQDWTLFQITGQLHGEPVHGSSRIPFVYGAVEEFPPLLKLHIGNRYSVIDSPKGAFVVNAQNKVIASYPSGSFFKGFLRPWFGLHTIDLLRREAVKGRIPFEIENLEYNGYSYQNRILTLHQAPGYGDIAITFDVEIDKNQIKQIEFTGKDGQMGILHFSYPATPEAIVERIEIPDVKKRWFADKEHLGILWLFELAQGTLARE